MREQLIGYLLDALDEGERRAVEERLLDDPTLRDELEQVRSCLTVLEEDAGPFEPPAGLAARVCRNISLNAAAPARTALSAGPEPGRWSLREWVIGVSVLAASMLVLFPAIGESRFNAGVNRCQDNLRTLGYSFAQYSENNAQQPHCFPHVPPKGNLSFAGVFAPRLQEGGCLSDANFCLCPEAAQANPRLRRIPTVEELFYASSQEMRRLRVEMDDFYGYTLGSFTDGRYQPVRNQQRAYFALLADAPSPWLDGRPSSNHGGRGVNVLFEYGNVRFIKVCGPGESGCDYIFLNDDGRVAAGIHSEDSVIVPAHVGPGVR